MSKVYSIAFQIAGKLTSSFNGSFGKANEKLQGMNQNLSRIQKELLQYERIQKEGIKEAEKSSKAHEKLKTEYSQSVKALLDLSRRMQTTKEALKDLTQQKKLGKISADEFAKAQTLLKNQLKESGTAYNQLKAKTQSTRAEMQRLADAHQQGKKRAAEHAKAHAELAKELQKAQLAQEKLTKATERHERVQELQGKVQNFSQNSLTNGVQTAASIAVPVYTAIKFESSMADVQKVVNFETPQQFKEMEQDIINLSKRIPMTATGLAQIVAAGGQAGIARDELLSYADAAAKMGVAFDITAEQAGQTMAEWRTAFKLNQSQVNTLADQINHLGNTTAASAPKISEVVQRIGPLGEVGGLVSGEIAALGASMVAVGTAPEIAATGIKNMILALSKGESATKSQKEAFQQLGLDAGKMAKMLQTDAQGAIMKVLKSIQKLAPDKQAAMLNQIFGSESLSAIAPMLTNLEMLQENFNKIGDSTKYAGSMQKEFSARSATTENKLILLKNHTTALGITIGNTVLPHLSWMAEKASLVASKVQTFSEKHPVLTRNLMLAAAGTAGLMLTMGGLGLAFSTTIMPLIQFYTWTKKIELVSKIATMATKVWTVAQTALNLVMRMNPIGLVITAITGLIAIGVILYKKFEPFRNMINGIWDAFKNTFPSAGKMIEDLVGKVGKLWDKFKKFLSGESEVNVNSVGNSHGVKKYATGGILTRPHIGMVAEAGPEAVIPLDGSKRAYSLWAKAGQLLGVNTNQKESPLSIAGKGMRESKNREGSLIIQVEYSPVFHGVNKEDIEPILIRERENLADQLKAIAHQKARVEFG